jgi:putative Mg2+ transporter-C (MgtC) family protein
MTHLEIVIRLLLSVGLGSIIGAERERHGRAAGLRTHALVCVGSCMITMISIYMAQACTSSGEACDPTRIASGIVTGIGFLGAGTIIRERMSIVGLTTAASLWTVSAIGMGVGCGFYELALYGALVVFFTLVALGLIMRKYLGKKPLKIENE